MELLSSCSLKRTRSSPNAQTGKELIALFVGRCAAAPEFMPAANEMSVD
jgi:hypothetical protein